MKAPLATIGMFAIATLTSHQPTVKLMHIHQAQAQYFFSAEDIFLNTMMVRAYNGGDAESLQELLQYWQDAHSPAI
jgi:hypothetical protein